MIWLAKQVLFGSMQMYEQAVITAFQAMFCVGWIKFQIEF